MPGIEFPSRMARNGIHTLIVFGDEWIVNQENRNYINDFLGLTFAGQSGYDTSNARSNTICMKPSANWTRWAESTC